MLECSPGANTSQLLCDLVPPAGVTLMFGLMVVLSSKRFLVLHLLGHGSMLVYVLMLGDTVGGGILTSLVSPWMVRLHHVGGFALFLAACRLCRGLNFGRGHPCSAGY